MYRSIKMIIFFVVNAQIPNWAFLLKNLSYFFQIDFNGDNVPEVNSAFPPLL